MPRPALSLASLARALRRPHAAALAAPWYDRLIAAQLALHRVADRAAPPARVPVHDVTALVKTFERPTIARRLIASIRRIHPELAILLVDDSRVPSRFEGASTLALAYDSGLSAGRNAGVAAIETPFVLVLDDDFVFYRGTELARALDALRSHTELDLVGGDVFDLPTYRCIDTAARRALGARGPVDRRPIAGLARREVVRNFFVARTARVRALGWDPALKLVEHADFFGRAHRAGFVIAHDPRMRVLHAKTPFDAAYMGKREDVARYQALLAAKWRR